MLDAIQTDTISFYATRDYQTNTPFKLIIMKVRVHYRDGIVKDLAFDEEIPVVSLARIAKQHGEVCRVEFL